MSGLPATLLVGSVWTLGVLNARRVRVVSVGAHGVVVRNAYGRHGETRTWQLANFFAAAEFDESATESASTAKNAWARAARLPKSARRGQAKRITPKQRVAAEQARARSA